MLDYIYLHDLQKIMKNNIQIIDTIDICCIKMKKMLK